MREERGSESERERVERDKSNMGIKKGWMGSRSL